MTFGQKLKQFRKRFGLSQEQLASTISVSRQAITKWERDDGLPDISNLQSISKIFNVTVDYLLSENNLPALSMRVVLDKDKYKNKLSMYKDVLKEYYPSPCEIYVLSRSKKLNAVELLLDTFIVPEIGPVSTADALSDLSVYYLVINNNLKLLVNIKDYVLEVIQLPSDINVKKFKYEKNVFRNCGLLKID